MPVFTRATLAAWLAIAPAIAPTMAHATTLPDAIRHWTGITPDVEGQGEHVRITLPPGSPIPGFTARAHPTTRAGDPGWQLTDVQLPAPLRLAGGARLTLRAQHSDAWLGDTTASANGTYAGLAVDQDDTHLRLDQAHVAITAAAGPATLDIDLAGLHALNAPPGLEPLLPQHLTLHGHTTTDAINALVAMFSGHHAGPAPFTLDALDFTIGPAQFTAAGTVTFFGPDDRRGAIELSASHFKELLDQMPTDGPLLKLYPAMMVLRAMAQKKDGKLVWAAAFVGKQVLINGIDVAAMF